MKTEQEIAKKIVDILDDSTSRLDRDVLDRLYVARMKAVNQLVEGRQESTAQVNTGTGSVLSLFGDYYQHHRNLMPAVMIGGAALIVFVLTQQWMLQPSIEHGDAFLLGAELPPEAFLDKGFDTWVARTSQQ